MDTISWIFALSFLFLSSSSSSTITTGANNITKIDNFSLLQQGIELVIITTDHRLPKNYKFEDFFWTGGSDGEDEDSSLGNKAKTGNVTSAPFNQSKCTTTNCEDPYVINNDQLPEEKKVTTVEARSNDEVAVDYQFWLVTVLEGGGRNPILTDLKESLEKLYKKAFDRHQRQHLGIVENRNRRATKIEENIKVHIHNLSKAISDDSERIQLIYHVSLSGKPVVASTAAEDMKLISEEEIISELGFAPVIKAEPYLKRSTEQSERHLKGARNTWLFIGAALSILFLLLLLATLLTISFSKRKKSGLKSDIDAKNTYQTSEKVEDKSYFVCESDRINSEPPIKSFRTTGSMTSRPNSESSSSVDVSPLVSGELKKKSSKVRPKGASNRTAPLIKSAIISSESDSSSTTDLTSSVDTILAGGRHELSAKSYLSMPSVRSFPKIDMPDSLSKILKPVSVLHLDCEEFNYKDRDSVSAMEDPGVISPIIYQLEIKEKQKRRNSLANLLLINSTENIPVPKPRPKTSYCRKEKKEDVNKIKGAWNSHSPSPFARPQIDLDQILSSGSLQTDDPAIRLIENIKEKVKKYPLPGSATANPNE